MNLYKIVFQPNSNSATLFGTTELLAYVSRIQPEHGQFLVLRPTDSGVMGKDGTAIPFTDCVGVYAREDPASEKWSGQDEIKDWLDWYRRQPGYISS